MKNQQGRRPTTAPPVHGSSEYSQSYATSHPPRPRNPIQGWTNRNRSDVLPSESTLLHPHIPHNTQTSIRQRRRQPHQRWPWQERAARSEIFDNPRVPDVNNNPSTPIRPRTQAPQRWPWQRRAQTSAAVFLFGREGQEQDMAPPPPRPQPKWPWQERALQSKIFEGVEEKVPTHKTYEWDQRKSPFFAQDESQPSSSQPQPKKETFPWQQKAQESTIFSSPDPIQQPVMKYPWDQRQSAFDVQLNPNTKFDAVSGYQHDFIKTKVDTRTIEPAGKRCYGIMDFQKPTPQTTETLGNHGRPEPLELSKLKEDAMIAFQFQPQPSRLEPIHEDEIKIGHGDNPATSTAAAGKQCYDSENSQRTSSYKSFRCNSKEALTPENLQGKATPGTYCLNHAEGPDLTDYTTESDQNQYTAMNNENLPLTSSKILQDRTNEIISAIENMQLTPVKDETLPLSFTKVITPKITSRKDPKNPNVVFLDLTQEN